MSPQPLNAGGRLTTIRVKAGGRRSPT